MKNTPVTHYYIFLFSWIQKAKANNPNSIRFFRIIRKVYDSSGKLHWNSYNAESDETSPFFAFWQDSVLYRIHYYFRTVPVFYLDLYRKNGCLLQLNKLIEFDLCTVGDAFYRWGKRNDELVLTGTYVYLHWAEIQASVRNLADCLSDDEH